jgi:Protein of unknown function (DUF4236)
MGFRFHRSIRILPGLRLNFGKRGISASIGVRGAHVTYGPTGTRTTVGLPGSGLSYTHLEKPHREIRAIPTTAEPPTHPTASPGSAVDYLYCCHFSHSGCPARTGHFICKFRYSASRRQNLAKRVQSRSGLFLSRNAVSN